MILLLIVLLIVTLKKKLLPAVFKKLYFLKKTQKSPSVDEASIPLSVNYHFTRKCNYECKFCFHQAKTSYHLPIEEAKRGIVMLVEAGMKKINFSGKMEMICTLLCTNFASAKYNENMSSCHNAIKDAI